MLVWNKGGNCTTQSSIGETRKGIQWACPSLHHRFEWNEGEGESCDDRKGFANSATQEKTSTQSE